MEARAAYPRVLFVSHTGTMSGAELVLRDVVRAWPASQAFLFEGGPLADALREAGLTIRLAAPGADLSGLRRDASPLHALPVLGRLARLAWDLAGAARGCDVVYANSQKAFLLAALPTRLVGRPLVWHLHDILDGAHFGRAQRIIQVRLANACAVRVVVPSRAAAEAFVQAGGRRDRVTVVPNGLDLTLDPRPAAELRAELGLPIGPLVGVFSRLAPWKGQDVVIEALHNLHRDEVGMAPRPRAPRPVGVVEQDDAAPVGPMIEDVALLRLPSVEAMVGMKESTIYRRIELGRFPAPVRNGERISSWRTDDIRAWLADPR